MNTAGVFLCAIATTLSVIAGVCFLRSWRITRDRFFGLFAAAFWLLAVNWAAVAWIGARHEPRAWVYGIRLAAFVLLVVAIVDKNRRPRR